MFTIQSMVLIAHVLISASIIGLVLLQRGKGADAGAAFGSGSSGTVFGARGSANFLSRTTGILAAAFFLTSLSLAFLGSRQAPVESLMNETAPVSQPVPSLMPLPGDGGSADEMPGLPGLDESVSAPEAPAADDAGDDTTTP
jgi:preprotein translocase subunit SecG